MLRLTLLLFILMQYAVSTMAQEAFQIGSRISVNTFVDSTQNEPSSANLSNGNFVTVWQSWYQDGSGYGIFSQHFDSSGGRIGIEFQINTTTDRSQRSPFVAALLDGSYIVMWESEQTDFGNENIIGQLFGADGAKIGDEFQVNTHTEGYWRVNPRAAAFSNGEFIAIWESYEQDGDGYGVYGQRFSSSGDRVGSEFLVNTTTNRSQENPSVATFSNNGFIIVWQTWGIDDEWEGIAAQLFDSSGNKVGGEFRVNEYTNYGQEKPSVAALYDNSFVVIWQSSGQDSDSWGIFGQRFDNAGSRIGSEFQVNTWTLGSQGLPSVSAFPDGDFLVTWSSSYYNEDDPSWYDHYTSLASFSIKPVILLGQNLKAFTFRQKPGKW